MGRFGVRCEHCRVWAPEERLSTSNTRPERLALFSGEELERSFVVDPIAAGWSKVGGAWICRQCSSG